MKNKLKCFCVLLGLFPQAIFSDEAEGKVVVDALFASLPSFSAVWAVEMGWKPNTGLAGILESRHENDIKGYDYEKGSDSEKALIDSLKKESEMTKAGYQEKRTTRLDFYTWDRFHVRIDDPRWEEPVEEVYAGGDGLIYRVSGVNKSVSIEKLNRYDLGNLIYGIPIILVHSFAEENQEFKLKENIGMNVVIKSVPLGREIEHLVSAELDKKTASIVNFLYYDSYLSKDGSIVEDPSIKVSFSGFSKMLGGKTVFPQSVKTEVLFNAKSGMKATWKLISLERISAKSVSPEYKFTKGYTVYDRRSEKTRIFQSDEVLLDKE